MLWLSGIMFIDRMDCRVPPLPPMPIRPLLSDEDISFPWRVYRTVRPPPINRPIGRIASDWYFA